MMSRPACFVAKGEEEEIEKDCQFKPEAWFYIFVNAESWISKYTGIVDHTLFIKKGKGIFVFIAYVDDTIAIRDCPEETASLKKNLNQAFKITYYKYFLGLLRLQDYGEEL